ncbi:MAG TPA: helix-turn-helix domain-containing protein [Mycobacteriales bacterium]|nr:helix-turn-helix domain-containing protein [Mycobacteriales bacterium]
MPARLTRSEQVERNRALLLEAAREVFLEAGYVGATVDAIAERAGFSTGVVYSQFGGKPELFLALIERRINERADEHERATEGLSGPAVIHALIAASAADAKREPQWTRVLIEFRAIAARDPELNRRYAALHATTVDRLASVMARTTRSKKAADMTTSAQLFLATGTGLALERVVNPAAVPENEAIRALCRLFGVAAP